MKEKDEIDLLQLLVNVVKAFVSNLKLFIIALLTGTIGGLAFYQFAPKVFESKIVFTSEVLTYSISKAITDDVRVLIKEHNYDLLGQRLNMEAAEASQIDAIQLEIVIERSELLKESDKTILAIRVQVTDKALFAKLQSSLIDYFENNEYSKIREKEQKKVLQGMIDKSTEEIAELEKLRVQFLKGELFQKSAAGTIMFDPTIINVRILDLTREKLQNLNSLAVSNSVQLIQGFTNFNKPISPKISISLATGASIGIFFAIALIIFKSFRKLLRFSETNP